MKLFRDLSILCVLLFSVVSNAHAENRTAKAKAKAALALASCEEQVPEKTVKPKEKTERPACHDDVESAIAQARSKDKPVVIWVGMTCVEEPQVRAALDDAVHCHAANYHNDPTPRLLILHGASGTWEFDRKALGKYKPDELGAYLTKAPTAIAGASPPPAAPAALPLTNTVQRLQSCPNGRCPNR